MKRVGSKPYIVIGIDESEQDPAVFDWAVAEARRRQWSVRLVAAQVPVYTSGAGMIPVDPTPDSFAREVAQGAVQRLAAAKARLAAMAPDVHVEGATGVGTAAGLLVAESREAHLLVVGRGKQGALREALAGSTSAQVVAHSTCPVVVVDTLPEPGGTGAVVVGVDASPAGAAALGYAFDAADLRGVGLVAVHAWWLDAVLSASFLYNEEVLRKVRLQADLTLTTALSPWRKRYPDVAVREEVVGGRPADVIAAAATDADLIVVGSRGHGGFAGLLLGSVSQGLLHGARPTPLLVVHRGSDVRPDQDASPAVMQRA